MFRSLAYLCLLVFVSSPAYAGVVLKVKGKSVLIDLKGDPASPGDSFYAVLPNGKRSGIVKISKVKGEKAIGRVIKGNVAAGMSMELQPAEVTGGGSRGGPAKAKRASSDSAPAGRSYWGGLFGYGLNSMDVNVNDSVTGDFRKKASLSGSGFSAKGLFDYEIFSQVWFRFTAGLEMFKVAGPKECGTLNQQTCDANINYLSMDFLGRYVFATGSLRPWLGAGVGLLFPMSKEASALQAQSISTTNVIMLSGGLDFFVSPDFYIPMSIEYGMLPKSDEVEASWIAFRVGFAVPF
jgi:hypothetical protein